MTKEKAVEAKNKGNSFFTQKDYQTAILHYSEAIKLDPNDHTFYTNRSASYAALNQHDKALADADSAIQLNKNWMKGHYRRGVSLVCLERYDEALLSLKRAQTLSPNDADIKRRVTDVEIELKRIEKLHVERGTHLPNKGFSAEREIGNDHFRNGRYEQAITSYTRALEAASDTAQKCVALANRAAAYSQNHQPEHVVVDATRVLELDPELELPVTLKALIRRGLALEEQEKWKLALADMRRVLNRDPSARQASDAASRLTRALKQQSEL